MVTMHDALWPFVPHNLLSTQESSVPLPKFQMAPDLKIIMSSGSKKGTQIYYTVFKKSRQANPLQVPQRGPYGEINPLTEHFYISLNMSLFIFPSESPVRGPPPCSLTGSPWTGILRHQSHWSIHSLIHVCLSESPKRSPPSYGEKHRVTAHGAPRRQKTYIQWGAAWFPKGIVKDTAISTPLTCSFRHDTFHLGLGRPGPR